MEYSKAYQIELALRKSIANELFVNRDKFIDNRDLQAAIKIVEKKN
jgi:hypothetical protein